MSKERENPHGRGTARGHLSTVIKKTGIALIKIRIQSGFLGKQEGVANHVLVQGPGRGNGPRRINGPPTLSHPQARKSSVRSMGPSFSCKNAERRSELGIQGSNPFRMSFFREKQTIAPNNKVTPVVRGADKGVSYDPIRGNIPVFGEKKAQKRKNPGARRAA